MVSPHDVIEIKETKQNRAQHGTFPIAMDHKR
jgi:hypothetical protein